jgi:CelD/BcsL family acetyltransferase involved in cellulose biosynthesis
MRVARIPIGDARWWEFVSSHPSAGPFHLPAWTSVIADCYGLETFVLAVLDTDGEILAGGPVVDARSLLGRSRWVSLSFSDSCPLLVRADTSPADVVEALTEYVLASRTRELVVRSDLPVARNCYPVEVGCLQQVELPADPADLHPRRGHRRMLKRARSQGIRIVRGTSPEDVATFYRLHTLTRRRLGVPVQPRRFFDLIGDRLMAQGNGFVATAMLDGEAISVAVFLAFNGTLVAKLHATGPVPSDNGAGHLLDWETMSTACTEGYHTLDLGRTDFGADGLRLYKAEWGAIEKPLVYTHISSHAPGTAPPSVGGAAKLIIRHSPPWVCRALGEVLYRWTA